MTTTKMAAALPLIARLLTLTSAQRIGTTIPEVHPKITTYTCTVAGGCTEHELSLVTDALAHPFHAVDHENVPCATMPLNATLCPDEATCLQNCVLEGVEYGSIGVLTSGSALTMRQYLFDGEEYKRVSPRVYLLAENEKEYEMMHLVNKELTFDVDVSQLSCGMNGALYLSEMEKTGSRTDISPAGAQYGAGYCDAQCFTTVPWINGLPNLNSSGSCCNEMDIWEANGRATVFTPHTCNAPGSFLCKGDECAAEVGVCDKPGCGLNPFRSGFTDFYGPKLTVDTSRVFSVVTQFISSDGTDDGDLTEIRRIYVQDGKRIENAPISMNERDPGIITEDFCTAANAKDFLRLGGVKGMGESLHRGMVLIFSIWNSDGDFMSWLDQAPSGPCGATEGNPANIVDANPDVAVTFANIRWGELESTFGGTAMVAGAEFPKLQAAVMGAAGQFRLSIWAVGGALLAGLLIM